MNTLAYVLARLGYDAITALMTGGPAPDRKPDGADRLAEAEAEQEVWDEDELSDAYLPPQPESGSLDEVCNLLGRQTAFLEDIRDLLATSELGWSEAGRARTQQSSPAAARCAGETPAGVEAEPPTSAPPAGPPTSELLTKAADMISNNTVVGYHDLDVYQFVAELRNRAKDFKHIEEL